MGVGEALSAEGRESSIKVHCAKSRTKICVSQGPNMAPKGKPSHELA